MSGHLVFFFQNKQVEEFGKPFTSVLAKKKAFQSDLILPGARQPFLRSFLLIRQKKGKLKGCEPLKKSFCLPPLTTHVRIPLRSLSH